MLQDRVSALRQANIYERQRYRHIVGLPAIGEGGRGGNAVPGGAHHARRQDGPFRHRPLSRQSVEEGKDLKFAERVVVCDSSRFDTLLAIPL
jgi:hypothetical protein